MDSAHGFRFPRRSPCPKARQGLVGGLLPKAAGGADEAEEAGLTLAELEKAKLKALYQIVPRTARTIWQQIILHVAIQFPVSLVQVLQFYPRVLYVLILDPMVPVVSSTGAHGFVHTS